MLRYYSDIEDMIVPVYEGPWYDDPDLSPGEEPTKDVWRRSNIKGARVFGGEVKARYTFSRNLHIEGAYSIVSSTTMTALPSASSPTIQDRPCF